MNEVKPKKERHQGGKVIRISAEVHDVLRRKLKGSESWDCLLRNILGLKPAKRARQPVIIQAFEGYLVQGTLKVYPTMAEAKGAAVMHAVARNSLKPEKPIKVREVF